MAGHVMYLSTLVLAALVAVGLSASLEKQNDFDTYPEDSGKYGPTNDIMYAMDPMDQCLFECVRCFEGRPEVSEYIFNMSITVTSRKMNSW